MKNVVLLISFAIFLHDTNGYNSAKNLLTKLNDHIESANELMAEIQRIYRDDLYNHPMPKNYDGILKRLGATLNRASKMVERMHERNCQNDDRYYEGDFEKSYDSDRDSPESARRSNDDPMWNANFYKALSRALRGEYADEPMVQENVHDGFEPPIWLKKRGQ